MVRGLNALAVSRFADDPNSTARRKWRARWASNPHFPELNPGVLSRLNYGTVREAAQTSRMRFCCRFRQSQMGKWHDRTEALHAGNRTRTAKAFATDGTPSYGGG